MAYRVFREVNRTEGRYPVPGTHIIAGQVLILAPNGQVALCDGAESAYGIAAESTDPLPLANPGGLTAGQGYDYTNFARGGQVSCFTQGSELELYDDGHGLPYVAGTYALNAKVYSDATGHVSPVALGDAVGSVVDFDVAVNPTRLRVKFSI